MYTAVDDGLAGAAEVASLAHAGGNGFNDSASDKHTCQSRCSRRKQKVTPCGLSLFRGALLKQSSTDSSASAAADEETVDTVLDELKRWEDKDLVIDLQEYSQYIAEDGLLNEFKMMWELRESFPLHFTVFKQTACHLAHEANVEKVFSRAGLLADPNLLPAHLSTLVMVGFNKKAFKPQLDAIKDKYYEMFRNKSGKETRV